MMTMKRDMTGAGVVLAVMAALGRRRLPGPGHRAAGRARRTPSAARSTRPGDVIRHYGGRTSEVTNTDAEGRLVLADALAYAVAELEPDAIVDVATLTGAMKIALGQRTGGLFANDDALAELLRPRRCPPGEPLWRMPLVPDYEERLASKVADADNAAGAPGAITAALFLQHFAGGLPVGAPRHRLRRRLADGRVRVLQGRDRLRRPGAAALAGAARAAGRRVLRVSLRLSEADPRHQASYLDALRELAAEGNSHYLDLVLPPEPGFPGVSYTLQTLSDPATFEEFCAYNRALADPGTPRPTGWVTGTYLWMPVDDTVVGRISLRHTLTPWLLQVGGHIGYAVRPSARRQGHATAALGPDAAGRGEPRHRPGAGHLRRGQRRLAPDHRGQRRRARGRPRRQDALLGAHAPA